VERPAALRLLVLARHESRPALGQGSSPVFSERVLPRAVFVEEDSFWDAAAHSQ
jgi:hypothetical protein